MRSCCSVSFLFGLLALLSVNMMISEVPGVVDAATCYHLISSIICKNGDPKPVCLPECQKECGPSAGATCEDQVGFGGPVCFCSFEAPDCQTQRVCHP